jgi:outer membrane protein OmpA-like peptidoglycan-associated protein
MRRIFRNLLPLLALSISIGRLAAQTQPSAPAAAPQTQPSAPAAAPQTQPSTPAAADVNKSSIAVAYPVDKGSSKVDLVATSLIPAAKGEAKVEAKQGITMIEAKVEKLEQPGKLGTQFLTYVLWAISSDGRTVNLGEMLVNEDGKSELKVTSQLQTFSLIVTAEPYFSVRQPSELVVLENKPDKDTKGTPVAVDQYRLMKRGQYDKVENPLALSLDTKNVPLQLYEARNAIDIAKSRGADKYAPEIYSRAQSNLKIAENLLQQKADKKEIIAASRQTVQASEDARALAVDKQEQERIAGESATAANKAKAEAEAIAATEAAAAKQAAQRQAELAAANEAKLKADSQAQAQASQAKEAAARAETESVRKAAEAERAELLEQLNRVLDTKDTPRGLVVNMADVLFDTGKYELRPEAREKLAKLSGVLALHPDLQLEVEGHTDSTGSQELNQSLSEQRAQTVARYLVEQGVPGRSVKSTGLGDSQPIADNSTNDGRQKNRRVEIIVSGEEIGQSASLK